MGCDIYLHTVLKIKHKNLTEGGISFVILSTQKIYTHGVEHNYSGDSDDENYEINKQNYYDSFLEHYFTPIPIYTDGKFICDKFEKKYLHLIHEKIAEIQGYNKHLEREIENNPDFKPDLFDKNEDFYLIDTGNLSNFDEIISIEKTEVKKWRA